MRATFRSKICCVPIKKKIETKIYRTLNCPLLYMGVKLGLSLWGKNMSWKCFENWLQRKVSLCIRVDSSQCGNITTLGDYIWHFSCLSMISWCMLLYYFSLTSSRDFEIKMLLITLIRRSGSKVLSLLWSVKGRMNFFQFYLFLRALLWFLYLNIYSLVVCLISKFKSCLPQIQHECDGTARSY